MIATHNSISADAAHRLVGLVRDHAEARGWRVAACVVDAQGNSLASLRMDGALPAILDFAGDKAFTAATMRQPTTDFHAQMESSDRLRMGAGSRARLLVWGGGLPIRHQGQVVGAIGVSGADEGDDIACAKAALEQLALG